MNEHVKELTDGNWDAEVLQAKGTVLVDFWASWCAPCRMIAPSIESLATEFKDRAKVGKLNVDDNPKVAERYRITSIPTLLVFRGGQIVEQRVGAAPQAEMASLIERQLVPAGADPVA